MACSERSFVVNRAWCDYHQPPGGRQTFQVSDVLQQPNLYGNLILGTERGSSRLTSDQSNSQISTKLLMPMNENCIKSCVEL
jgi:hypothetical protein